MSPAELAKEVVGRHIPIEMHSVQDCPEYNCLLIDDLILLSYREASVLLNQNKAMNTFGRVLTNRLVRYCVVKLYNAFLFGSGNSHLMLIAPPTDTFATRMALRASKAYLFFADAITAAVWRLQASREDLAWLASAIKDRELAAKLATQPLQPITQEPANGQA